ncbi:MAG TPA: hypothetical protein ENG21_00910 [Nitrososphaeria archaeon]|nr:hypothetical protein [Nitrososphaeria archaeon]
MTDEIDFEDFLGRRTLIVGDVGTGKTRLLSYFLDYLIEERGCEREVTLIEMAPAYKGIGAPVESYTKNVWKVRYLKPAKIFPPRMLGRDSEEVLRYAEQNRVELEPLLLKFERDPTKILLINDLTIFLHAGDPEKIIKIIDLCETFAATAYEGERLRPDKGSGITQREERALTVIKEHVDKVIYLVKPLK